MNSAPEKLIPLHGGYRKLKSFQVAQLAYDVTVRFCDRYIDPPSPRSYGVAGPASPKSYGAARRPSRMADQMIQAARSGVQNIAEGIIGASGPLASFMVCCDVSPPKPESGHLAGQITNGE